MPKLANGQRFHWYELDEDTVKFVKEVFMLQEKGEKLKGPDELRRVLGPLGALKPSIQIMKNGSHIEAHAIWPEIFDGLTHGDDKFYMAVPFDYRGEHFVPSGAKKMDPKDQELMEMRTGAAWGQKVACIYHRAPFMIDTPADFDEEKHDYAEGCSVCSTNFAAEPVTRDDIEFTNKPKKPEGPK